MEITQILEVLEQANQREQKLVDIVDNLRGQILTLHKHQKSIMKLLVEICTRVEIQDMDITENGIRFKN